VYVPASRSVNPARKNRAHGRTRTCILLIRNQVLSPIELRVRDWCRDGDTETPVCRLRTGMSWPLDERGALAPRPGFEPGLTG
jgi:hypothetical protein